MSQSGRKCTYFDTAALKQFEHKSCKAIDMSSVIKMFSETKAQKMPFNIVLLKSLLFWHR